MKTRNVLNLSDTLTLSEHVAPPMTLNDERAKLVLREISYGNTIESLRQQLAEKDAVISEAGEMLAMRDKQLAATRRTIVRAAAEIGREWNE